MVIWVGMSAPEGMCLTKHIVVACMLSCPVGLARWQKVLKLSGVECEWDFDILSGFQDPFGIVHVWVSKLSAVGEVGRTIGGRVFHVGFDKNYKMAI